MVTEIEVREAGPEDLPGVLALERSVVEAPHWALAEYEASLARGLGSVLRCLVVGVRGGAVEGFAVGKVLVLPEGVVTGELESVVVDVGLRRRGLGREMCGRVVEFCQAQGAEVVELEVRAGSVGALRLYMAVGFREGGRRRGYYKDPVEDAQLMRLEMGKGGGSRW